ncbi:Esterase EstB [Aquisphaera giovannonii]|uniref:Esterase EstB n=1 Tax=Aquisphaera giovannonii TaxID=406548 RepID=A0A5B9W9M7_9BACT|nr:serine hydrolase domain-containing protein [Aquisphaera giovannonii]QEH36795.1 Esterase EstB [Aquisphaera giovannonii]
MTVPAPHAASPRRLLGLVAMLALLDATARAQDILPRATPESVGVSSERLQRVHEAIQRQIDDRKISGAVTLVARRGFVVHLEAHGLKDIETKAPMTVDTIFKMASCSKPVTAAAVLMLVEEGKIRLNDPASKFIPEFKDQKVAVEKEGSKDVELVKADREVTVRDLLTHTSGLLSGGAGSKNAKREDWWPKEDDTLATVVPRYAKFPLDFQPSSKWQYSGIAGIDTLARIVEVASGQTFDLFLRTHLFEPLGMKDTTFVLPDGRKDRLATIYQSSPNGLVKNAMQLNFPKGYPSGAGGLYSTAADYFRFGQMLLNGGRAEGGQVLCPRSVSLMSTNQVGDLFTNVIGRKEGMAFGFAVEIVQDPVLVGTYRSAGSFGWDGAFGTHFFVDPQEQLVAVLLIQTSNGRAMHPDFETAVMQSLVETER